MKYLLKLFLTLSVVKFFYTVVLSLIFMKSYGLLAGALGVVMASPCTILEALVIKKVINDDKS